VQVRRVDEAVHHLSTARSILGLVPTRLSIIGPTAYTGLVTTMIKSLQPANGAVGVFTGSALRSGASPSNYSEDIESSVQS